MKPSLLNNSVEDMSDVVRDLGLKPYAATQILGWLYKKRVSFFDEMTNLSKEVRELLKSGYSIGLLDLKKEMKADDGTTKFLCEARDKECVECVLIPSDDGRWTVCVSTQVGCKMGCSFCRTGKMGFKRNLSSGEIISELLLAMKDEQKQVTNVVLMGMGEPLDNYGEVVKALEIMTDHSALNFSKTRITVSTVGLFPELERFVQETKVKLAISLNATTDESRAKLMPTTKKYPLEKVMAFCREYAKKSRHRVTFEYVMIKGVNDTEEDAKRLVKLLSNVKAKVNLIPFNAFAGSNLVPSDRSTIEWWSEFLYQKGIQANIRVSRGSEILAACGQLASE